MIYNSVKITQDGVYRGSINNIAEIRVKPTNYGVYAGCDSPKAEDLATETYTLEFVNHDPKEPRQGPIFRVKSHSLTITPGLTPKTKEWLLDIKTN
jgi:hypothetical protein